MGLIVREITFFDRMDHILPPDENGVIVQAVEPALPAGIAGVTVDDVIREAGGDAIDGVDDFRRTIEASEDEDVILFVRRDHQTKFIQIRAGLGGSPLR